MTSWSCRLLEGLLCAQVMEQLENPPQQCFQQTEIYCWGETRDPWCAHLVSCNCERTWEDWKKIKKKRINKLLTNLVPQIFQNKGTFIVNQ